MNQGGHMHTSHGKDKAKMFDRERMLMCVE